MSVHLIPALIHKIYGVVSELEGLFPDRSFTPDGIMVGSIGEVLAEYHYGLKLLPTGSAKHDARTPAGVMVQVKTTQRSSIDIRNMPEHLLVLKLDPLGTCKEYYNGPGQLVWDKIVCGKPVPKSGFYSMSLSRLARLQKEVLAGQKIERVQS
jgi:hypothetical protein